MTGEELLLDPQCPRWIIELAIQMLKRQLEPIKALTDGDRVGLGPDQIKMIERVEYLERKLPEAPE